MWVEPVIVEYSNGTREKKFIDHAGNFDYPTMFYEHFGASMLLYELSQALSEEEKERVYESCSRSTKEVS